MEDLIIVKREKKYNFNEMAIKPLLKVSYKKGRFHISSEAAKILDVKANDGVMFAFNMKDRKAWIFKESEPDAFMVRERTNENQLNFTSVELAEYFDKCFKPKIYPATFEVSCVFEPKKDVCMFPIYAR